MLNHWPKGLVACRAVQVSIRVGGEQGGAGRSPGSRLSNELPGLLAFLVRGAVVGEQFVEQYVIGLGVSQRVITQD